MLRSLVFAAEPSPPTNFVVDVPVQRVELHLSWMPGFSFEGEDVAFVITIVELFINNVTEFNINNLSIIFSQGRGCQEYMFIVHSKNLFGISINGSSATSIFPSGELYSLVSLQVLFPVHQK